VPIVHAYRSLGCWGVSRCRGASPIRPIPSRSPEALKGCDCVVHAALGDAGPDRDDGRGPLPAAERAGIKRIVALSSARCTASRRPRARDETTAILINQKSEYNTAKAKAEALLDAARRRGKS